MMWKEAVMAYLTLWYWYYCSIQQKPRKYYSQHGILGKIKTKHLQNRSLNDIYPMCFYLQTFYFVQL